MENLKIHQYHYNTIINDYVTEGDYVLVMNMWKGHDCTIVLTFLGLLIGFNLWQDCCLIPESPFYLEGRGGLFEYVEQRLKENKHMVIVLAEGAGQEYVTPSLLAVGERDASGNRLLLDIGLWLTQKIKVSWR